MIYFTAHTIKCVCHSIRSIFRVLGVYNFGLSLKVALVFADYKSLSLSHASCVNKPLIKKDLLFGRWIKRFLVFFKKFDIL